MNQQQEEKKSGPPITLKVISADRVALDCRADMVVLPGKEGDLTVLPEHFPLISHLDIGVVQYEIEGEMHYCFVNGGAAQIGNDEVVVVTSSAEKDSDIDFGRVGETLNRARQKTKSPVDEKEALRARSAIRRAESRLEIQSLLKQKQEEQV